MTQAMTENRIHNPELDAEFPADNRPLDEEGGDEEYRTILEIWTEVLKPVDSLRKEKVRPQWATRIVSGYYEISFKDMTAFRDQYYAKVDVLRLILEDVVSTDDECFKRISPEEDAQLNGMHYREVITRWQKEFFTWELRWDCEWKWAAIELAAIAEVHKMFFSPEGLIGLLDQIDIQFTEADQEALAEELQELKDSVDGR